MEVDLKHKVTDFTARSLSDSVKQDQKAMELFQDILSDFVYDGCDDSSRVFHFHYDCYSYTSKQLWMIRLHLMNIGWGSVNYVIDKTAHGHRVRFACSRIPYNQPLMHDREKRGWFGTLRDLIVGKHISGTGIEDRSTWDQTK